MEDFILFMLIIFAIATVTTVAAILCLIFLLAECISALHKWIFKTSDKKH